MSSLVSYRHLRAILGTKKDALAFPDDSSGCRTPGCASVSHRDGLTPEEVGAGPRQGQEYLRCIGFHGVVSWLHEAPPTNVFIHK